MMRKDKELVFKLRQQGKSYRQIQKETGVSRATLTAWFKNISWSRHASNENGRRNAMAAKERMQRMNLVRKLNLQYHYAMVESQAAKEYESNKKDPLFWAGLMVYAGSGDRSTRHLVRLSSSEFYMHAIFLRFIDAYLKAGKETIKICLIIHSGDDEKVCTDAWQDALGLKRENFYKSQLIKAKEPTKRLQYGVGMSILSSTALKKKLQKWLQMAEKESFKI